MDKATEIMTEEFVVSREFNAPRELVFKAWTDPAHLAKWWGPKGFNITSSKMELHPGGIFLYSMVTPDSQEIWGKFIYREITPPEKLVFITSFSDRDGGLTRIPWLANWPMEVLNVITFTENNGKTTLNLKGGPINASEEEIASFAEGRDGMAQGFAGAFEQLDAHLASVQ
jgi:uncharacterized protein YndB with AHSA1/START domain